MTDELKPCKCGAKNSNDNEMLQIQFAAQTENSTLKREGTIFYIRCLNCGYIGPLVLCPNGFSKKKIFAAWNTRHEPDTIPSWAIEAIENLKDTYCSDTEASKHAKFALDCVLSMRKLEEK